MFMVIIGKFQINKEGYTIFIFYNEKREPFGSLSRWIFQVQLYQSPRFPMFFIQRILYYTFIS